MKKWFALCALTSTVAAVACSGGDGESANDGAGGSTANGSGASAGSAASGGSANGSGGSTGGSGGSTSGGGSSVGDGPGPAITMEEYCEKRIALEQPWCDYISECCTAEDQADSNFNVPACSDGMTTVSECVSNFDGVAGAGAVWNGTWADACITELAKLYPLPPSTCSGIRAADWVQWGRELPGYSQIPACRNMMRGSKAQGEPCEYSAECGGGLICFTVTGDAFGDYQCVPEGTSGSHCVTDNQCQAGLFCVGESDGYCGELGGQFAPCVYSSQCEPGLLCTSTNGCQPPKMLGDSCDFTDVCDYGTGCGFATDTCILIGQYNEACTDSYTCDGRCDQTTGTCTQICGGHLY